MPHLILEYSENIISPNFTTLFKECHGLLANHLRTHLKNCRSRAVKCDTYYIGDGDTNAGFVHLTVKIMPGRTPEILQTVGQALLTALKNHFSQSEKILTGSISIEFIEIQGLYLKV